MPGEGLASPTTLHAVAGGQAGDGCIGLINLFSFKQECLEVPCSVPDVDDHHSVALYTVKNQVVAIDSTTDAIALISRHQREPARIFCQTQTLIAELQHERQCPFQVILSDVITDLL